MTKLGSANSDSFLPAMSEIAREAGALLMHYFHQHLKIEYKGDADLVTAADRAAEALIRDRIRQKWPTHDVLGEGQRVSLVRRSARWYDELRARISGVLRFDGPRIPGIGTPGGGAAAIRAAGKPGGCGGLRSHARRVVYGGAGKRCAAEW